jgi:hypothetical protein
MKSPVNTFVEELNLNTNLTEEILNTETTIQDVTEYGIII